MYLNYHELDTVGLNDLSTHNRLGPAEKLENPWFLSSFKKMVPFQKKCINCLPTSFTRVVATPKPNSHQIRQISSIHNRKTNGYSSFKNGFPSLKKNRVWANLQTKIPLVGVFFCRDPLDG